MRGLDCSLSEAADSALTELYFVNDDLRSCLRTTNSAEAAIPYGKSTAAPQT